MNSAVHADLHDPGLWAVGGHITPDYAGVALDNKCGPSQSMECRGHDADQPDELGRQRTKLIQAIAGQGSCNLTRRAAAEALVDWLASDPTGSGDDDFLILGDLNSYAMEDPIDAVRAGADDTAGTDDDFTNLINLYQGTYAYSYTFDGQAGYLDYAMSSADLTPQVTGAADWHINSDEPTVLDYDTSFKPPAQDALFEPNAYRSSDHDPVVVGLDLGAGNGAAILVGGDGDDSLSSGNGRDVLIGGQTSFDHPLPANRQALCAAFAQWADTSIGYTARVAAMSGAFGTVVDTDIDGLVGSNGLDWFIVSTGDTTDRTGTEVATTV